MGPSTRAQSNSEDRKIAKTSHSTSPRRAATKEEQRNCHQQMHAGSGHNPLAPPTVRAHEVSINGHTRATVNMTTISLHGQRLVSPTTAKQTATAVDVASGGWNIPSNSRSRGVCPPSSRVGVVFIALEGSSA